MQRSNLAQLTDSEVLEILKDDATAKAMEEIHRRYWKVLLGIGYNHLGNKEEAEEIVQDILISLWCRRTDLAINNLGSYLATATKFKIFTRLRERSKEKIMVRGYDELSVEPHNDDHEKIYAIFLKQQIDDIIDRLPEKCRLVFHYSRNEGKKNTEISQILNVTDKAIEAHISKALKILRSSLKNMDLMLAILYNFF